MDRGCRLIVSNVRTNKEKRERIEPYLLILPAFIVIGTLILYPILRTFYLSMMEYSIMRPDKTEYVGLLNYSNLMKDRTFVKSLRNTFTYSVITVFFQFIFGLALALLMRNMRHFKGFYRATVFAPWAVSGVLTAIIWTLMFNGSFGVVNDLLLRLGFIDTGIPWKSTPLTAYVVVIVSAVWRGIPYFAISMLAALSSFPEELFESAKIDGAGSIKIFFKILLPFLKETIILTTLLRLIWTFCDVDLIYSLTAGGPNNSTLTLPVYITKTAVDYMNFGYGGALTVGLFIILLVFSALYMQLGKSSGDFSA